MKDLTVQPSPDRPIEAPPETHLDGRRQRTADSRARIIQALMELIRGGTITPSAEQVASKAQVGLRSVFRHFNDMDSLYHELTILVEADARATFERPIVGKTLKDRIAELAIRRAGLFERIGPFQLASLAHRAQSSFLDADARRQNFLLRELLKQAIAPDTVHDDERFEILDMLLSFSTWNRLRQDQGLEFEQAQKIIISASLMQIE